MPLFHLLRGKQFPTSWEGIVIVCPVLNTYLCWGSAVIIGSILTFWYLFCTSGHITTSSVFAVSISTWFRVKPVYSSYIFNDKKTKTLTNRRFPVVFSVFSGCWFLKARKYRISAFPGAIHNQWELSANAPEANTLLDTAVLNWSRG